MDLKTNEPFGMIKNGIIQSYPSLQQSVSCDVLIVGGGITGSLVAYEAVKEGYNTVLIDKREIGHGSTSATTSMLQYEIDVPLWELSNKIGKEGAVLAYQACAESILQLEEIVKEIGSKAGFKRKKSLYAAHQKSKVADLKKEWEARKQAGLKVEWLTASQVRERWNIAVQYPAIQSDLGASVDAFRLTHELLQFASHKGAQVFDKSKLVSVVATDLGVRATLDSGAIITAKKIVYATGYETLEWLKLKKVDLISTFVIVSEQQKEAAQKYDEILFWNTDSPYVYARTTDDHRLLIGGGDVKTANPKRREALISKKAKGLNKKWNEIFPETVWRQDFAWAGTFGVTKDGLPYIGTHKKHPNAYFILGFGGNGITFSMIGAKCWSRALKSKSHPLQPYMKLDR